MPSNSILPVAQAVRPTTLIAAARLSQRLGVNVTLASETFQTTGSFKYRAAYHLASRVAARHIITASSGNFGQALAYACRLLGKTCHVVMPDTSVKTKVEAVQEYGGIVDLISVARITRQGRVEELGRQFPEAYLASAYDDPLVIEGNATLGTELAKLGQAWDFVLAPVGGGGLISGLVQGLRGAGSSIPVVGVEPLLANDAARSIRAGRLLSNESEPATIADGVRTVSLGKHNWAIVQKEIRRIVEVTEEEILEGMRMLFWLANLKAEPTGALGIAALLHDPATFRDKSVCCVVSGGNAGELGLFKP